MLEHEETDFLLDTVTAALIAQYCMSTIQLEPSVDFSLQLHDLIQELKNRGVEPAEIDNNIKNKDFTHMLTAVGSGNREREFVMDYVEEVYRDCN